MSSGFGRLIAERRLSSSRPNLSSDGKDSASDEEVHADGNPPAAQPVDSAAARSWNIAGFQLRAAQLQTALPEIEYASAAARAEAFATKSAWGDVGIDSGALLAHIDEAEIEQEERAVGKWVRRVDKVGTLCSYQASQSHPERTSLRLLGIWREGSRVVRKRCLAH
jgi:hypothetical protein